VIAEVQELTVEFSSSFLGQNADRVRLMLFSLMVISEADTISGKSATIDDRCYQDRK
jgi:hypothetical protein